MSKQGYYLKITDKKAFEKYLSQQDEHFYQESARKDYRVSLIIFLLLQNSGYISLNRIAEVLDVSRSTIIHDINEVKKQLEDNHIQFDSRSHYGIKITGKEKDIRQMLSKISRSVVDNQSLSFEFFEFIDNIDFSDEKDMFISLLHKYNIMMTNNAIESILFHLKILIYRVMQKNDIHEISINRHMIDENIYAISSEMLSFIEKKHHIKVKSEEIDLVASQIFGKASSKAIPQAQKKKMEQSIKSALKKVDYDYNTAFSTDEILCENLLLHIYPLIMRVSFGLSLSNSLISSISVQYMNAFLVTLRFIDYHEELQNYRLSRDEIGYLALHFAAYIERENQGKLKRVKKVVLVADNMRSSTMLIKTKLESMFPFAMIIIIPFTSIKRYSLDDVELIISTSELELGLQKNKLVIINERMDDNELRKIKNQVLFNELDFSQKTLNLSDLFFEDLFMICEGGTYFALIEQMCEKMISKQYAQSDFTSSVIEREKKFTTIYENDIATPHSLIQMANIDSIGVILLKRPISHENKEVRYIFVLNVRKGHLLLHQEISNFIVRLMRDRNKLKLLELVETYQDFKALIKDYL